MERRGYSTASVPERLSNKLYAAHLASKPLGVVLVFATASLCFVLFGIGLILGTYKQWYKDENLTLKRYPFPPYVLYLGEFATVLYGYIYGIICIAFGFALAYGFVI